MSGIILPKGEWELYANEQEGELNITNVDNQGNVTGTAFGSSILRGSFIVTSGQIDFIVRPPKAVDTVQMYTGYISEPRKGDHRQKTDP